MDQAVGGQGGASLVLHDLQWTSQVRPPVQQGSTCESEK